MNKALKYGIVLTCLAIIFFILSLLVFPFIILGMIIGGTGVGAVICSLITGILLILAILFIIVGPILIILGFIKEPRNVNVNVTQNQLRNCPECGRGIPLDAAICPYCGHDFNKTIKMEHKELAELKMEHKELAKSSKYCLKCGAKIEGNPKFCYQCGTKLR